MPQQGPRRVEPTSVCLLFVLVACSLISVPSCSAADLQLEGFQYVKAGNFSKALECFNAALKVKPNSWQILQSVGICEMELGHYDTAVSYLQKSIEVGGLHAIQCNNMAAVYQRWGEPRKALNWLKLACSVDPSAAYNPAMQAQIAKLQDPENNPTGSPTARDYLSSLTFAKGWPKTAMPIRVYVRQNMQLPGFYPTFQTAIRDAFEQWCEATDKAVSYKWTRLIQQT